MLIDDHETIDDLVRDRELRLARVNAREAEEGQKPRKAVVRHLRRELRQEPGLAKVSAELFQGGHGAISWLHLHSYSNSLDTCSCTVSAISRYMNSSL